MNETEIYRTEKRLNRFNHTQINFKVDAMLKRYKKHKILFSHIDSDHYEYHKEIEVMLIQNINKYQAKLLAEEIENIYQLETYYCKRQKHLEITLYQHLS